MVEPPTGDVVTESDPVLDADSWVQQWVTRPYTAEEKANKEEAAIARRLNDANNECGKRIVAVVDPTAQINLAAAAAAGALTAEQMDTYRAGVAWIGQTRQAWPGIAADPTADIYDDANWPQPSAAMVALGAAF